MKPSPDSCYGTRTVSNRRAAMLCGHAGKVSPVWRFNAIMVARMAAPALGLRGRGQAVLVHWTGVVVYLPECHGAPGGRSDAVQDPIKETF